MPRYTWRSGAEESGQEFNACHLCAGDPTMMNAVLARRLELPQDQTPKVDFRTVKHRPFDFSPTPVACAGCGRVLGSEDD